tara:strand:- start:2 stop:511 length:510 start_codon:yes stop_codon:yes gene_type:complete
MRVWEGVVLEEQIIRAKALYPFDNLRGSISKGKSNIYGALGEVIIHDLCERNNTPANLNSTYDYDLIIDNKYKVDVKTKRTTVKPKPHYLCSISSFNTRQECDFYFFLRVTEDLTKYYLLGYKKKKDFFNEATFNKKGTEDVNGWLFKDDCYNLEISHLQSFNHLYPSH